MLFSQLRLSSLSSSKRWAPKAVFSNMSDSLPVLSDLDIQYSHRRHRENWIIYQLAYLLYCVTHRQVPDGRFSYELPQLDVDYWHEHIQIHILFNCHMILQDVIIWSYNHNCYIHNNIFILCCPDLLEGPFLLADFLLGLVWEAGDVSRDCRSGTVLIWFNILDWTCCWKGNKVLKPNSIAYM